MRTIEELENANAVLQELTKNYDYLKERERNRCGVRSLTKTCRTRCHRCDSRLKILSGSQYCPDCNWDSLEDPCSSKAA